MIEKAIVFPLSKVNPRQNIDLIGIQVRNKKYLKLKF